MDASSIGALTGTTDPNKKKSKEASGDADAFASAMGQASEAESDGDKKAQLISKDESAREKADKVEADKKAQAKHDAKTEKQQAKGQAKGNVSDYLKNIANKDPATLSMVERQAFRLGEFSGKSSNPASGITQMLMSQGIDLTGFTPQQLMSMLSRMDTKELGQMMSQMKDLAGGKFDEDGLKKLKEQLNSTNQANTNAGKEQPNFNLESFMASGMPKEAGESARQEQRRMVMDQLLTKIQVRNVANQTEMQLRLNPEYLGEVKISLIHDDEGGVKAKFSTTSKLTREVLAENKNEFMDRARGNGVRIGSMDVELVDDILA